MTSRKSILLLILFLAIASGEARAQWKITVPNLVPSNFPGHAMCFCDGILWIAADSLYKSLDSGLTWSVVNTMPGGTIPGGSLDVDFIDTSHGVIASGSSSTYLTSDGGLTLTTFGFPSRSACFGKDTLTIGVANEDFGTFAITSDGGKTWANYPSTDPYCVRRSPGTSAMAGDLLFFWGASPGAYLSWTSDQGTTWNVGTTGIDWDSYSFAPDSCDENRIYLSHDNVSAVASGRFKDSLSKIILTTDLGNTWQTVMSNPEPFFAGSIVTSREAVYCPTIANGIFRSTDRGMTWVSIGGPNITLRYKAHCSHRR